MQGDFTRFTFRPKKHYHSVLQQQGRVSLDADWNEQGDITAYRAETEARDVIGPCGAPKHDAGFAIAPAGGGGDFTIGAGRFYVDGILCENDAQILFTAQPDLPGTRYLQAPGRYIVYLDAWQRHLTALDDPEIREVALGGPDTATRAKTVWQIKTVAVGDIGSDINCASEPSEWKEAIQPSTGQLRARAQPDAQSDRPCIVPPGAGYRRLENQLYRVEIHGQGELGGSGAAPTFKWSRDNGSIAARIASITGNEITLTTSRKDSALGFAPGQWIEIIDAGQELRGDAGALARITAVDDLVLTVDQTNGIGAFPPTPLTPATLALLPKVRRWDSVGGVVVVSVPSTNNGFIALEDGVEVKFEPGSYRTGDYWMIPARTDKGTVEWPQVPGSSPSVAAAQPAMGIRHHFCRLAVIEFDRSNVTVVEDCRPIFPPLTEIDDACGCCSKTVGETGAADYRSIQAAVDSLPVTGGQICVLDGTYAERVLIARKRNITIIGCGRRSVLRPGLDDGVEMGPIIQIESCANIRLESLLFRPELGSAVVVLDSDQITICECEFVMSNPQSSEPAIFFQGRDGLIERNVISAARRIVRRNPSIPSERLGSARADETTPLDVAPRAPNDIEASAPPHAASGIQLAGGCARVRVINNLISRVRGQGITLGNLEEIRIEIGSPEDAPGLASGARETSIRGRIVIGSWRNRHDLCDDCKEPTNRVPKRPPPRQDEPPVDLAAPDSLREIHIERNRIRETGLDGIGVIGFFDLSEADEFVTVRRLTILGNQISNCLRAAPEPISSEMANSMGYGGIALADVSELIIHDNAIERSGVLHAEPVCGIFILHGDGIDIERNRILGNGGLNSRTRNRIPSQGRRGGIQIVYALAPMTAPTNLQGGQIDPSASDFTFARAPSMPEPTGFPALKVHNNIVSSPIGPALSAVAVGPVSVVGNQLTTGRLNLGEQSFVFAPATVFIFNLGVSNEFYGQQILFAFLGTKRPAPAPGLDDQRIGRRLANGNILFANNQCSLGLLDPGASVLFTSLALASLDDIAFLDNQCDCNLALREDFVIAHALLLGASLRVTGNRFKEGLLNAIYSAMTFGLLNTTVHNQATHCLMIKGASPALTVANPNTILLRNYCRTGLRETMVGAVAMRKS